ncbi:MAG: hypothetical protein C4527_11345 [Candidatus Omnitrophota bacterium]|nr:MAG: hypothetical protein C4527_11345 [Candidatus Omnitrophota bacterium]
MNRTILYSKRQKITIRSDHNQVREMGYHFYENVPLPNSPRQRCGSPFPPVDEGIKGGAPISIFRCEFFVIKVYKKEQYQNREQSSIFFASQ